MRNEWDRETSVLVCPRTGVRNEWDRETSVLVMSLFIFAEVLVLISRYESKTS